LPAVPEAARDIRARLAATLAAFGAVAAVTILVAPAIGSTPISIARAFDRSVPFGDNLDAQIFFVARLPRVLAAALVGSGLAAAGVVFQALLRNPLASSDTLGVSAGASLGAMIAITFGADFTLLGISAVPLASFAGSIGGLAIVYLIAAARRRGQSSMVLLLAGVALSALLSALVTFVRYLADVAETFRTVRWLMGSLDIGGYQPIVAALLPMAIAFAGFATLPRVLNLVSLGTASAEARGVDVVRAERTALVCASISTGAAVSLGGPVGFIGIIVPHLVRLIVGADHRLVLPASALFGAAFLVVCDLIARSVFTFDLPVGIITAVIGGPVFLWLLFRRAR
jgi:iron complex transport system permease protein